MYPWLIYNKFSVEVCGVCLFFVVFKVKACDVFAFFGAGSLISPVLRPSAEDQRCTQTPLSSQIWPAPIHGVVASVQISSSTQLESLVFGIMMQCSQLLPKAFKNTFRQVVITNRKLENKSFSILFFSF